MSFVCSAKASHYTYHATLLLISRALMVPPSPAPSTWPEQLSPYPPCFRHTGLLPPTHRASSSSGPPHSSPYSCLPVTFRWQFECQCPL